jgi:hypothetical protein
VKDGDGMLNERQTTVVTARLALLVAALVVAERKSATAATKLQ